MHYIEDINIEPLLEKPVWQMTGREFCALSRYANSWDNEENAHSEQVICEGVESLAQYLGCSPSKVYELKRNGILDASIIPSVGRRVRFNGNTAQALIKNYINKK